MIDYLSIDTEGSELDILNNFDFNSYQFRVITCEHNYSSNRDKIYNLLSNNGYKRVMTDISQFDDYYIKTSIWMFYEKIFFIKINEIKKIYHKQYLLDQHYFN